MLARARQLTAAAFALATFAVVTIVAAPAAFAHHAEITASTRCGYEVEWTATSWAPGETKGSHPHILVEYQLNGSGGWTKVADEAFTTSKGSFTGSFVAPGTPTSIKLRVRPDANYTWDNGQAVSTDQTRKTAALTFDTDCDEPSATAVIACASGGVAVTLRNDGTSPATFDVTSNGSVVAGGDGVVVNGGATSSLTVPIAEDATAAVVVTASGTKLVEQSFTRNCVKPFATLEAKCAADGAVATLRNDGDSAASFELLVDGAVVKSLTVDGGATATETLTLAEGKKAVITAREAGTQLASLDVTPDCVKPAVATAMACSSGGAVFTFSNAAGERPVGLTVKKDGDTIDTVSVEPDKTVEKTYTMAEDSTATFRVTGADYDSGAKSLTFDCVERVASTTTTTDPGAPSGDEAASGGSGNGGDAGGDELPLTGSALGPVVLAGTILAGGGAALLRLSRSRRHRPSVS